MSLKRAGTPIGLAMTWLLAWLAVGGAQAGPVNPTAAALAEFTKRINEYATLHRRLANTLGPLDITKSPAEISGREKALGEAIRAARAESQQGDIVSPQVAQIFRKVIREDYSRHTRRVRATREDAKEEVPAFKPQVNQVYPTAFPLATFPPILLRLLPELPKEVEYRIVAKHVVLRDTEANIIIDFVANIIP